ncbi:MULTISPECIES: NADPH-dependent FMN reductase [Paenibacillus]|uniref:NADPH-dependent FMN reductase n=1 Tax=Paenibacillus TaxID=44249 RepID=UPI0022B8EF7D|nr:NADPH-dependent FMN reductase [Paenibacillus caseinilyticus]MCZ8520475.1 NAD(P)H-dependent oxidoreductase [Paenibacillus caseinilyticus]
MKLTLIAGSNRSGAASTRLLRHIEALLQTDPQVTVSFVDLLELPLPLFSPDSPEVHPNVLRVTEAIAAADGLILATPEYHGSISGTLKNALDYINGGQMAGKAVLSLSSAGGPLGVSSLSHLQSIVRNLHGVNCPEWISIGYGTNTFSPEGAPLDEGMRDRIQAAVGQFAELVRMLTAPGRGALPTG